MSVTNQDVLRGYYNAKQTSGAPSINSDASFVIAGHEGMWLQTKQFPWPTIGPAGEIEVPEPLGAVGWEAQQLRTNQQGPITFSETSTGRIMNFMEAIVATGGKFDASVFEGTPDRFVRGYKLKGCFFVPDQPDRDWENRAQITLISGTLFFRFFGERIPGNIPTL